MLAVFESNVLATLRHHAGSAYAAADDRADRSAFAAARDQPDDRADTRSSTDFRSIVFRRVAAFDATFGVDLRVVAGYRRYFDELGVQSRAAIVRRANLIECQLQ